MYINKDAGETAIRPVLHQASLNAVRPLHHHRDGEDGADAKRVVNDGRDRERDDGGRGGLLPGLCLRRHRLAC